MKKYCSLFCIILALSFAACQPSLKKGENVDAGMENAGKYWKVSQAQFNGDTLVLTEKNAAIISKFRIKNFTMTADLITTGEAEGLIDFHTGSESDTMLKGYSIKINNTGYRTGSPQKTGGISRIRNNYVNVVPDNNWFKLKIEVKSNRIAVFVNNRMISEYIQPEMPVRMAGMEDVKLSEGLVRFRKTTEKGTIALGDIFITEDAEEMPFYADSVIIQDATGEMLDKLNQENFPVIDFHAHLKGGLTVEQVCEHGRYSGYNYGLAPNCGLNFPVTNDSSLIAWYNEMAAEPVFKAMQCEGREWITLFTPDAISLYDYIFTDAMTWTDHKGRRMRLWIPEETFVDSEQQFMEMLVAKIEVVLVQEPVDIYVNPTYLPEIIAGKYDELWTPERMNRVIHVLIENNVALEINSRFKIPSLAFIRLAKKAGVKFTLGTNNGGSDDLGRLEYALEMIKEAGLSAEDMFLPRSSGDKKVMLKGLPVKVTG